MGQESFLQLCREQYGTSFESIFQEALSFAQKYLGEVKRLSGDSFFEHNLRVAEILADSKVSPEVIVAGILHGVTKYVSEKEVENVFGKETLALLKGVQEIKLIKSKNPQLEAEALRRILLTTFRDVRIIFVKLATKLDNLRTIQVLPADDQKRIAEEVLEVYAPLANRLGLEKIKNPLEDLALQILHPEEYTKIVRFLEQSREQREALIAEVIKKITDLAAGNVEIVKIKGRSKHLYSIYKKMTQRKVPLAEQYDLSAIRVIVPEVKDCYTLLGLLHEQFEQVEGKLKDYIATPKPNFYRSLHTSLKLAKGKFVEIQIRTLEMDEFAEEGVAAHWRYKGLKSDQFFEKKIAWLKGVLDLQKDGNQEFLEMAKVDVFGDNIYCYTPKGAVKELPKSATILDFAYLVHEEVGNHAVGGRVNGKFVPLKQELFSGDVVEVVTNKSQRPRRDWLKIVKSGGARQKIRKSLREHEKLPAMYFKQLKPVTTEEQGILAEAPSFANAVCVLAKCCYALPGEEITGLATKRRIISVHKTDCRAALKEEERWIKVQWKDGFNQKIRFYVTADERSGLLADLLNTVANTGFEVKEAKAKLLSQTLAECSFLVVPRDLEHLKELVRRIQKIRGLKRMYFE
ncbi:bifunctional (p)ppGpp synthetase/guanosine-3',5'-bis(diphosphate) 3'-pyrophosphohydrolase [Candidatus Woesearchaeota archaeon]|nr:bifunctional (p)ppGpp synthetase/guanosine-3',5'-bis(diphosphate) 3'-pyrophosphohydrolase [Candidatus Woesearchaeota archaeon]